jgi:hypothetical protein
MKVIKSGILSVLLVFLLAACDSDEGIKYISVKINAVSKVDGVSANGLKVILENFDEGVKIEKTLTGETTIDSIIPGIYNITISGQTEDQFGKAYNLSGALSKYSLTLNDEILNIDVTGTAFSPLLFKEIFYAGTKYTTSTGGTANYFRNQFYEIYNNSQLTVYLDGIYFANLTPTTATKTLPVWPTEDGSKYAYAERIWKFPGTGTQYPLLPGESVIVSQFAVNHKLPIYCPESPVDCSGSEFEFNMNNANFPDQPADDMIHVYYNGKSEKGTIPQYLTTVFGGAYVIFKVPEGVAYDPVGNTTLQTKNLATTSTTLYAKIPVEYLLDVVEAVDNEAAIQNKRVPATLDAGATYVGATYNSLSVTRKTIGANADGTPIIQDTNNSTNDFIHGAVPEFRRYGAKVPSWNHTLAK